jgi:hypothetical protein
MEPCQRRFCTTRPEQRREERRPSVRSINIAQHLQSAITIVLCLQDKRVDDAGIHTWIGLTELYEIVPRDRQGFRLPGMQARSPIEDLGTDSTFYVTKIIISDALC